MMTNYNERLYWILERYRLFANMAYSEVADGLRTADEFKDIALPKVLDEAEQAITSLNKELVAEAKPAEKNLLAATLKSDGESRDRVLRYSGYNLAINHFEQNLLKELEEL